MANFLAPVLNTQQVDSNGDPLNGGTVEVYLAGSSTPVTTYSTQSGTANTWPITLNTLGLNSQGAVWLTGGAAYKYVVKNAAGVTQRTIDNVSGINDSAITTDQWVLVQSTPTYVSATSFTVPGDQTLSFPFGTRIKTANTAGTVYSTVVRSAYGSSTTVTVINDSGTLDSGLSAVSIGVITAQNFSLPGTLTLPPFRNRVINGAFRFDQRNSGASQAVTAAAAIAYSVDRFYVSCTGANAAIRQVAGTGYKYAVQITGAASVTATLFGTRIESSNCYDWANRTVNVQVPISSTSLTTLTWTAYSADVADVFSAKTLIATGTLTISSTIETKYFSFAAGANALRGVAIEFVSGALLAAQTLTFQGALQAEAGQLSSFEQVELGEDIRRCQRYYELGASSFSGYAPSTNGVSNWIQFSTQKRASATVALVGPGYSNGSGAAAGSAGLYGYALNFVITATGIGTVTTGWTASAEL